MGTREIIEKIVEIREGTVQQTPDEEMPPPIPSPWINPETPPPE